MFVARRRRVGNPFTSFRAGPALRRGNPSGLEHEPQRTWRTDHQTPRLLSAATASQGNFTYVVHTLEAL
jgi:hypothetical protein